MKALTKEQLAEKARLMEELSIASTEVEAAVGRFNEVMEAAKVGLGMVIEKYNEALADARSFAEDVAADIQTYIDERAEKWVESDRGQQYANWLSEWEQASLDDVELQLPSEVESPELAGAEVLDSLPDEPA